MHCRSKEHAVEISSDLLLGVIGRCNERRQRSVDNLKGSIVKVVLELYRRLISEKLDVEARAPATPLIPRSDGILMVDIERPAEGPAFCFRHGSVLPQLSPSLRSAASSCPIGVRLKRDQ